MPASESGHLRALFARIYAVARRIPRGRVATYGQLAELAGIPGGSRVAGAAMKMLKSAPRASTVPWQRVIGKTSRLRGKIAIHDPVGAAIQRGLLEREGVEVGDRGSIALDVYGWLPTAGSSRGARPRRPLRSGSKTRASSSRR
jgi:methylated-DNA-protein-cysteine methyltransferase-like protein